MLVSNTIVNNYILTFYIISNKIYKQRIRWINDCFLEDVLNDNYILLWMARKGRNML
jgi:hypothetical protein